MRHKIMIFKPNTLHPKITNMESERKRACPITPLRDLLGLSVVKPFFQGRIVPVKQATISLRDTSIKKIRNSVGKRNIQDQNIQIIPKNTEKYAIRINQVSFFKSLRNSLHAQYTRIAIPIIRNTSPKKKSMRKLVIIIHP